MTEKVIATQPSGKKCFVYCGDDSCDCEAHPRFAYLMEAPMIVMSAETREIAEKEKAQAVREVAPATKADVDRLFDEIRRLQDTVGLLLRNASPEAEFHEWQKERDAQRRGELEDNP